MKCQENWTPLSLRIFAAGNRGFGTVPSEFLSSNGSLSGFPCMTFSIWHVVTSMKRSVATGSLCWPSCLEVLPWETALDSTWIPTNWPTVLNSKVNTLTWLVQAYMAFLLLYWIWAPHSIALTSHSVTWSISITRRDRRIQQISSR